MTDWGTGVDWKKTFKPDLLEKIRHADIEYRKYKSDDQLIYLQQACGKLFSAVENFLMLKYQKRTGSFNELHFRVMNNDVDNSLLQNAKTLHEFFYNGEVRMLRNDADRMYNSVRDRLKSRLR